MSFTLADPMLSGGDFAHLRAFVAVGQALSFTRAAEALGVTPSALSQVVRTFEDRIGVRLLNRTTRSVSLTEAGENLLRRVAPAVAELSQAVGQARLYQERPSGTVRVHTFRSAAELYIQPILPAFRRAYPSVVLDVTVDDEVVDTVAAGYDAAIRLGEVIERDMVAVPLEPPVRQIPVAAPSYIAERGTPVHPRDLLGHDCIRWRWPGRAQPYRWEFYEDGAWLEVEVAGPLIVNSKDMALQAAIDGVGVAFSVERTARQAIADGRLVAMLEAWCEPFPGHHLCFPQQRQMSPGLRAFIDTVREGASAAC
ncbi:LysR family transcriptional regulator [Caulobacter radicis]|uniref:LysR family transcriptional regulator n=1 Tax=Caulobacter radicis TaxID=2172650 RepID=A0A2T9K0V7_9CAUL|nr:LysR family transcriptional regulator [Caulobacter radicis]PVM89599.1 LysR family transcriptional regulator [Caulobacter radicis]